MQILESVKKAVGPRENLANGEWSIARQPTIQHCREVVTFDEIHDEKLRLVIKEVVGNTRQVLVFQPAEQLRLALERFLKFGGDDSGGAYGVPSLSADRLS